MKTVIAVELLSPEPPADPLVLTIVGVAVDGAVAVGVTWGTPGAKGLLVLGPAAWAHAGTAIAPASNPSASSLRISATGEQPEHRRHPIQCPHPAPLPLGGERLLHRLGIRRVDVRLLGL
ncbi:MAG: hypothetical protein M3Z06_07985, partial [Actinomycetota bacterium]|nr:hypothetical protein [Actinomycetota bacterium]